MTTPNHADLLSALLKRLRKDFKVEAPSAPSDPMEELVRSFLLYDSTSAKADNAYKRIRSTVVDFNDLRACLNEELVAMLGERYPGGEERATRLRATLHDIFKREHAVSLESLRAMQKRDARAYLVSLDGMAPFVAARVVLLSLGGHAAPVDERLVDALIDEEVVEPGSDVAKAAGVLERAIKATEAVEAHLLLWEWSSGGARGKGGRPKRDPSGRRARAAS